MTAWSPRAAAAPVRMPRAMRRHLHKTSWECGLAKFAHPGEIQLLKRLPTPCTGPEGFYSIQGQGPDYVFP